MSTRAQDILAEAASLGAADREAFLRKACGSDEGLRREVESLLAALSQAGEFLAAPTVAAEPRTPQRVIETRPMGDGEGVGTSIGPYRLLDILGEGGFGVVYRASQDVPVRREVAVKVIKLGMDTREVVARFEAERQALAMMDHLGIARVFDGGATPSGRPFFVMELVRGIPINEYCDAGRLDVPDRLRLFIQVCRAIQHAHQKGVIHRDIKPSNVLVSDVDGEGRAKVIDFGIAKATAAHLTSQTLFTRQGQFIGTPEYMSPEQAGTTGLDVDTRTDVYSLGVLLYELLTGATPLGGATIRSKGLAEMQRVIREVEPPKPSTRLYENSDTRNEMARRRRSELSRLLRTVRGELDWITMKALEKDRNRRYESAAALSRDVERYLAHEAVEAGPPSASYRIGRFVRRHRGPVIATAALAVVVVLGAAGTTAGLIWALDSQAALRTANQDLESANNSLGTTNAELSRARADAEQRAADLAEVVEYQSDRLGAIDAQTVGSAIRASLRSEIARAAPVDADERVGEFDGLTSTVEFTDVARAGLLEGVFEPSLDATRARFADRPLVRATLLESAASAMGTVGLLDNALAPLQEAVRTRTEAVGPDDESTLAARCALAIVHQYKGEHDAAYREASAAFDRASAALGANAHVTLRLRTTRALQLVYQGRAQDALPELQAVLDARRAHFGDRHASTIQAVRDVGWAEIERGHADLALPYYEQAATAYSEVLGTRSIETLGTLADLGWIYRSLGRWEEAERLYREALSGQRDFLGADHHETLVTMNNLGILLQMTGRVEEAFGLFEDVYERRRRTLGPLNRQTLRSELSIGTNLFRQGRLDEALAVIQRVVEESSTARGPRAEMTLHAEQNLGQVLRALGRPTEARDAFERAHTGFTELKGDQHPFTMSALRDRLFVEMDLADDAARAGQHQESIAQLRAVLRVARSRFGASDITLQAVNRLALALGTTGEREESLALTLEGLDVCRQIFPPDHPGTQAFLHNAGAGLMEAGRSEEAIPLLEEVVEVRVRVRGESDPETIKSMVALAEALAESGRTIECEAISGRALELARSHLDDDHTVRIGAVTVRAAALRLVGSFGASVDLLLDAERLLRDRPDRADEHRRVVESLADSYEAWERAEPGGGHGAEARQWREASEPVND